MKNDSEIQYNLLRRIISTDDPIELYSIEDLSKMGLSEKRYELISVIIEKNKRGFIPLSRDLSYLFNNCTGLNNNLKHLRDIQILASPSDLHFAKLLGKHINNHLDFSEVPEYIRTILENYRGARGSTSSWRKKLEKSLYAKNRPRGYIALFFDENGPVYRNCFPDIELKYVPKKLEVISLTPISFNF